MGHRIVFRYLGFNHQPSQVPSEYEVSNRSTVNIVLGAPLSNNYMVYCTLGLVVTSSDGSIERGKAHTNGTSLWSASTTVFESNWHFGMYLSHWRPAN